MPLRSGFRRLFYYADVLDQRGVVLALEKSFQVKYVLAHKDLDDHSTFVWPSVTAMPRFGVSDTGEENGDMRLLIMITGQEPTPSYAYTNPDGLRVFHYSFSQNRHAIDFVVAGRFEDRAVVRSSLAADTEVEWAKDYFSAFRTQCRKAGWTFIKGMLVSPGALSLNRQGYRLTQSIRASSTVDLIIDS